MLVIGLTGGIGSGKSTVAKYFAELGIEVIDADQIARDIVEPGEECYQKVIEHFGNGILHTDQTLNRKQLRKLVFNDPQERQWLEALLHPKIRQVMAEKINTARSSYCIVMIPLLIENQGNELIDRVLVVDSSEELQIARSCDRDQSSVENIKKIIASQASRLQRLSAADDVIENDGGLDELRQKVLDLHRFYLDNVV